MPVWSGNGDYVAFQSDRDGDFGIFWQRFDGTTTAERLRKPDKKRTPAYIPESWSHDGKTLLLSVAKGSSYSLAALSLPDKKKTLVDGIQSTFPPAATFSPDGKWVAYSAGGSGAAAGSLFVRPFPTTETMYPISKGPGIHATWSPDGQELFYFSLDGQLLAMTVKTRPTFSFSNPVPLPRIFVEHGAGFERNNDIMLDGKRFIGVVTAGTSTVSGAPAAPQIQIVLNWFEELKARVRAK